MNYFILKIIAFIFMTIDHIGAAIILPIEGQTELYIILRILGRIAFPIFAFLLVNGYYHTSDKKKYLFRLVLFALISEPIFDFGFFKTLEAGHQNIYITLSLGFLCIWCLDKMNNYFKEETPGMKLVLKIFFYPIIIGFISSLASTFRADYDWFGIVLISSIFLVYKGDNISSKLLTSIVIILVNIFYCYDSGSNLEMYSCLSILFIMFFKDKKVEIKKPIKILCYIYYPLHILILTIIRLCLGY